MLGIVDFAMEDDLKYAIRKLDDTEFERGCYVRVKVGLYKEGRWGGVCVQR